MAEKIRIKDIAERAGVSVGTVDRVLHDRPNVSKPARDKVEKALKEMNYQPNVYASALAYNKSYTFYLLIPKHESEAYWEEIEEGAKKCEDTRRDFHKVTTATTVHVHFNTTRYDVCALCIYEFSAFYWCAVIFDFYYFIIFYDYTTIFQPTLWSQDLSVVNLF